MREQIIFDAEVTGLRRARDSSQEQAPRTKIDLLVKRARSSTASQTCTNPTTGSRGESILGQNASEIPGVVTCDYAVAADGAGSVVRAAAGIGLSGKTGLGYLVNVHFRCKELGSLLRDRGRRPGMLYFVYNEACERGGGGGGGADCPLLGCLMFEREFSGRVLEEGLFACRIERAMLHLARLSVFDTIVSGPEIRRKSSA